jgi:YegS/Rv2252/BmrU family lipid kinase
MNILKKRKNDKSVSERVEKPDRIAVIFNPLKSKTVLQRYIHAIQAEEPQIKVDVLPTENSEDVVKQAKQAADKGCPLIVVAGGDGTLLKVINGVIHSDTLITTLPLGTANDYSKALGINNVEDAVAATFQGLVKDVDIGLCTYQDFDGKHYQQYFCSTAGVGLLANVFILERTMLSRFMKKLIGNAIWPLLTVICMFRSNNVEIHLTLNDHEIHTQVRLFEISKVREAGDMLFTPYASFDNGIFDVWMIHNINRLEALNSFLKAQKGKNAHLLNKGLEYFTSQSTWNTYKYADLTRIEIHTGRPLPIHLHGEVMGQTPAVFEIVPKSLKVLAHG